jgi:hypothetical protein
MNRKEIEPPKAVIQDKERHESVEAVTTKEEDLTSYDNEEVRTCKSKLVRQCQYDCSYASPPNTWLLLHFCDSFDDCDSASSPKNNSFPVLHSRLIVPIFSEVIGTRLITYNISVPLVLFSEKTVVIFKAEQVFIARSTGMKGGGEGVKPTMLAASFAILHPFTDPPDFSSTYCVGIYALKYSCLSSLLF